MKKPENYDAYDYLVYLHGEPKDWADEIMKAPYDGLKEFSPYLTEYTDVKIAAISDTDCSAAIPMAYAGAKVTVFSMPAESKKYALKAIKAAGVYIDYEICDILESDLSMYKNHFDVIFTKKAALHYFYDIERFMKNIKFMLKPNGKIIFIDFQPFYADNICCVSKACYKNIQIGFPEFSSKRYTTTDIIHVMNYCGIELMEINEKTITDGKFSRPFICLSAKIVQ